MKTTDRVFEALYSIADRLDEGDLSGVEAALDVLATEIIRAKIVTRSRVIRARAHRLSDVLNIAAEKDKSEDLTSAIEHAVALEEYITAHNYGEYSEETIESAEAAIESLSACLEGWLESLSNGDD